MLTVDIELLFFISLCFFYLEFFKKEIKISKQFNFWQ